MPYLKIVYYGLLALSLITLLFNLKRLDRVYYWFIPLISLAIVVQVLGDVLKANNVKGYSFVFHIYQPLEYVLLASFYYRLLKNRWAKKSIVLSVVAMIGFSVIYYSSNYHSFYGADFIDFCVQSVFISVWVIIFFGELLRSQEQLNLAKYPAFWINSGNLLFYAGCLFVMGLYFYLHKTDEKLANDLLQINHYLNLILYLLYSIAFICTRERIK
jgi:hypothetical protein